MIGIGGIRTQQAQSLNVLLPALGEAGILRSPERYE